MIHATFTSELKTLYDLNSVCKEFQVFQTIFELVIAPTVGPIN